jgi:potassium-transporting ATPase KdpC subunit
VARHILISIRMLLVCTVVLGVAYPLVVGGAALLLGNVAQGSTISGPGGGTVGSELLGQKFESPKYFHGRPSAAGKGYDAMASGGSNLGPTSKQLANDVAARVRAAEIEDPAIRGKVPVDMVTSSGSGLDPDISPANAYAQVARVAGARGVSAAAVNALVARSISGRQLGLFGEPRVNVLRLNLALDALQ